MTKCEKRKKRVVNRYRFRYQPTLPETQRQTNTQKGENLQRLIAAFLEKAVKDTEFAIRAKVPTENEAPRPKDIDIVLYHKHCLVSAGISATELKNLQSRWSQIRSVKAFNEKVMSRFIAGEASGELRRGFYLPTLIVAGQYVDYQAIRLLCDQFHVKFFWIPHFVELVPSEASILYAKRISEQLIEDLRAFIRRKFGIRSQDIAKTTKLKYLE